MLNYAPEELKKFILLEFTKKLIINSSPSTFLEEMNYEIKKNKKELIKKTIQSSMPSSMDKQEIAIKPANFFSATKTPIKNSKTNFKNSRIEITPAISTS